MPKKQSRSESTLPNVNSIPVDRTAARVVFNSSGKPEKRIQRLRAQARKATDPASQAQLTREADIMERKRNERDRKRLMGPGALKKAKAALARAKWERGE